MPIMNTKIITDTARKTLDGTISFPEVVNQLLAAGVEYYHVDYVGKRKAFYSENGDVVVEADGMSAAGQNDQRGRVTDSPRGSR